jgi:parallel beta-helix repeat protein
MMKGTKSYLSGKCVLRIALGVALMAAVCQLAPAATWCVNPGGTAGCQATIGGAVALASPGDTIQVAPGTYAGGVVIGIPVSLVGAGSANTIINANGQSTGIYIDGLDNPGLANVSVSGFTVVNANFEGILVTNAWYVTISSNILRNNNKSLNASQATCPGQPDFETAEGFDCGEAIHLSGAAYSTVANNTISNNAGGVLLSDDTGPTTHNLITGNLVSNNPFDCGITLASHPPAAITGATAPFGVTHNTIAANQSLNNGLGVSGAGAGVGMFTFLPGGTVSGNVVIANRLTGNGLPGVAIHGHSPGENLSGNMIVGNHISGNGADTEDAATPGPAGINAFGVSSLTGLIISQNVIQGEMDDIVVNNPASIDIHFNDLRDGVGVANLGSGTANATQNWWGCSGGPGASGCGNVSGTGVSWTPWLSSPLLPRRF